MRMGRQACAIGGVHVLRVGIAGLGTVGGGLIGLLRGTLAERLGDRLVIDAVSARNRGRSRGVDISAYRWFDDPCELAADPSIDVLVELIGGSDGPARRAVTIALTRGARVVTANKALLAEHGAELAALVDAHGGALAFEAAVGGGVPVIKVLRESLAANRTTSISGILNGTCNYILSTMEAQGREFADVLAEAQRLGYAEADPSFDVDGMDAGHKIALLAAIAFGNVPSVAALETHGIRDVSLLDIRLAAKLGYRIKLIATAERSPQGVRTRVAPALVPFAHPLAGIGGALNAVVISASPVGVITLTGAGAGAGPTASAVASDLIDIVEGDVRLPFGVSADRLGQPVAAGGAGDEERAFLRLLVDDRPGVIAAVSNALAKHGVSIDALIQDPSAAVGAVPIVLTTHRRDVRAIDAAVADIGVLDAVTAPPLVMRIEDIPRTVT
jgi:homoserine dehydrogenase